MSPPTCQGQYQLLGLTINCGVCDPSLKYYSCPQCAKIYCERCCLRALYAEAAKKERLWEMAWLHYMGAMHGFCPQCRTVGMTKVWPKTP